MLRQILFFTIHDTIIAIRDGSYMKTAAPGMASMAQRLYLIMASKIHCKDSLSPGWPQS